MLRLSPGDPHPLHPHWRVEKVYHSPDHMDLFKFQWVRQDGVRGTLMGWLGLFESKHPEWSDGRGNIGADFDLIVADKNQPMGPVDPTIKTHRWHSWTASAYWPDVPEARPMEWDESKKGDATAEEPVPVVLEVVSKVTCGGCLNGVDHGGYTCQRCNGSGVETVYRTPTSEDIVTWVRQNPAVAELLREELKGG